MSEAHSVVVVATYGLTDTTASSSVDGWCRDVTVTHSPGFTVLIAASPLSGAFMRIVRYWLGASVETSSAGRTRFSSILRPLSAVEPVARRRCSHESLTKQSIHGRRA